MSGGAWMFIWLMVALKIPLAGLLYIVWWATREPEPEQGPAQEPARLSGGPPHPRTPRWPRPPRRGPHAEPAPRPPQRVRAQGHRLARSH